MEKPIKKDKREFANHHTDREPSSLTHMKCLQIDKKNSKSLGEKWAWDRNGVFSGKVTFEKMLQLAL